MERDVLARVQRLDDLIYQLGHCLARARNTTIGNGKRVKFEAACRRSSRFASQGEVRLFSAPGKPGRSDAISSAVDSRRNWSSFTLLRIASECSNRAGGCATCPPDSVDAAERVPRGTDIVFIVRTTCRL